MNSFSNLNISKKGFFFLPKNLGIPLLSEGSKEATTRGFPGGAVAENLPANAGDTGSSPGLGNPTCRGATRPVSHNY